MRPGGLHPQPDPARYHHQVSHHHPFIPIVNTDVPGTGIRGLHQLPLPNSSCVSSFSLPVSFSPTSPGVLPGPRDFPQKYRGSGCTAGWGGGQVYTSISSSNLSYSEHHTGNDASWPVNLHADGLRAAVPSSCYWPRPGDAGQVSQRRSRQHPALRSNPARAGKASRLSQAPTSGSIERFYLILAEPVTR